MPKVQAVAPGIYLRGDGQYQVKVRMRGQRISKTFDTLDQAKTWRNVTVGKISGEEYIDRRAANKTTLRDACDWYLDRGVGSHPDAKNVAAKLRYWRDSELSSWALSAIRDWDLIEWRRRVLDEDNAEDGMTEGPEAEASAQTVIHRLNTLSKLFQDWSRAHKVPLDSPVKPGVRPGKPEGRNRRLREAEGGTESEEQRLITAAARSTRPWLQAAIIISLETCMRQGELAGLTWDQVKLSARHPHVDLLKTKNDRQRRVPLSHRAIEAFRSLAPVNGANPRAKVFPVETTRGIIHAFRDAIKEADFPSLRWHDLRHEAISRLFELTDLRDHEIMAISGHLSPAMLARYTHLRSDRLAARLPGGRDNPIVVQA